MDINKGLLDIKPYVGGKPKEEVEKKYNIKDTVKMNSNENPIGVSPVALTFASNILSNSNVYPESSNIVLRNKIAKTFKLSPDNIIVGNGADEVIYYIAMSLINDNDEVIIPKITFPIYEIAFKIMRAKIVISSMDENKIDLEDILKRITKNTKVIALCNPNNPTGHAIKKDEIYRFIRNVPTHILIAMDEAYMEFADTDDFPDTISMFKNGYKNLFIIRTFSKAYGLAGFRVGYGIGEQKVIEIMHRIKLPFNISIIAQNAALGALIDSEFLQKTIKNTKEGRRDIYKALNTLGLKYMKSSTNFILIDTGKDGDFITEKLMKRGIIVRSAKSYGTPTSIRVTVGKKEQNRKFIEALKDIFKNLD